MAAISLPVCPNILTVDITVSALLYSTANTYIKGKVMPCIRRHIRL